MTWASDYRFSEPLQDLRSEEEQADRLRAELLREVGSGHPLHGLDFRVIARALPQDEVIVETDDGRVALVHLTWAGRTESPPWPTTEFLDSAEHLEGVLEFRY